MLFRDRQQLQRRIARLSQPLLPGLHGLHTHIQHARKERLRQIELLTELRLGRYFSFFTTSPFRATHAGCEETRQG